MMDLRNPDQKNMLFAVIAAALLIIGWQLFVEGPKRQQMAQWNAVQEKKKHEIAVREKTEALKVAKAEGLLMTREERLAASPRLAIESETLHGSLALRGLRFDDLSLSRYRVDLNASEKVRLLSPAGDEAAYFADIGWLGTDTRMPDENTVWKADRAALTPESPVVLRWDNGEGVIFRVSVALDRNYMFTLGQSVENQGPRAVSLRPYALINRAYKDNAQHAYILHEGPLGVLKGALSEIGYKELREEKKSFEGAQGWLGFTDKYWLTALIPAEGFDANFNYYQARGADRYQAEYTAPPQTVAPGGSASTDLRFFAGAKELETLDAYAKASAPVPLFDRAVDFGSLYFLTKPMFLLLNYLFHLAGNFGVAILLLTIIVKLIMFPFAHKGYRATHHMRRLQPDMERLRKEHGADRMKFQQELIKLYRDNKVNPASGCLPIIIQIPVFFALYKVLYVTIEMRHAPFFGWIHDLSAADPSNLFTAFGLIPWLPPLWLHLGILPILMCATMVIQMRQQPTPADPTQAKVMKFMPFVMLVVFAKMPAGLVLYWTWSNLLTIAQQFAIARKGRVVAVA